MPRPVVRFTLGETAATTPYQSKIGGTPYLPKNAGYPHHTEKKHPLTLAAQINFAEVPHTCPASPNTASCKCSSTD